MNNLDYKIDIDIDVAATPYDLNTLDLSRINVVAEEQLKKIASTLDAALDELEALDAADTAAISAKLQKARNDLATVQELVLADMTAAAEPVADSSHFSDGETSWYMKFGVHKRHPIMTLTEVNEE